MKKILWFVASLLFLFIPQISFAEPNFTTDYNVTYYVLESSLTHVSFDITLTNTSSQYYASSYNIQVGFDDIKNVLVRDSGGRITPQITKNADGNNIAIVFNDKVVGLNKKLNFQISFDTSNIAEKSGKIWDINIPGLNEQKEYSSFNVRVIVPQSLGAPAYIKPESGRLVNGNLMFSKEELGESGISISFGDEQIYNFNLTYHLKNPNLFPVETEIALPPTTNYQDVEIDNMIPKPENVTIDEDGNWLAQYILGSGKKLDVTVTGKARVMLTPKKDLLSKADLAKYLKEQPYWQINKQEIKDLASRLKTPYAIYQYVVNNLTYNFNRATTVNPRLGAYGALKDPKSAVCLEFTDLFIAIARAADIPAREVNGFAYTKNSKERPLSLVKDVLHAWPEYYDYGLQSWIMIDPTWSNTTGGVDYFHRLDFDHLAFTIKGVNSTYPIPAGGYKTSDNNSSKDIDVSFGADFTSQVRTLTLSEDFAKSFFSGFTPQGNIIIRNNSNLMSIPQDITVTTTFLQPLSQNVFVNEIPPFGFFEIPVNFKKPSLLTNKTETIKIAINKDYISKDIKISPFVLNKWTILGGALFVIVIVGISIIIYAARHLPISKQKR